ncbi:MAG TPA: DUF2339 domain-containing protein [Thermoanaerobaculia bacterium]|nr:DUF2339 domain-containing protein [Thermoanaerobaculia bacterium]
MILLGLLAGVAALAFGAWLRGRVARDAERVARLEWEIKAMREEIRKISAPPQTVPPVPPPAVDAQTAGVDSSSQGEEGIGQAAAAASYPADASPGVASGISSKGEEGTEQAAPPVAFPIPPVAFPPPHIPPSKQFTGAAAAAFPIGSGLPPREGAGTPPVPPPPVAPPPAAPAARGFDWESFVGVKLFSWIAGVFLTIGAVLFLRYSIDHGWLSPPVQMAIGLFVGIGLLMVCELKAARRYAVTANALDAAGLAILFASVFAGHARWNLIGLGAAFLLMALVAALAVALALRRDSLFIAALGLLGGFATPALLSTGEDRPIELFSYLLILNAGLAWVAFRKRWVLLSIASLVFTTCYQWGWVVRFLAGENLGLAAGIFLVFPLVFAAGPALASRERGPSDDIFGRTAAVAAALPSLFALYVAGVGAYGEHWGLLFGFLALLDAGLFALAVFRGPALLHAVGGIATLAVLAAWFVKSMTPILMEPGLTAAVGFSLFYLFAPALAGLLRETAPLAARLSALGLLGHVLLLFVATQKSLSLPPDPRAVAALALVTVAAGFAARREGTAEVQMGALALGPSAVIAFSLVATRTPWPAAAVAAAVALAAWGVGTWVLDGRREFARAACVGLVLGEVVTITASLAPGAPKLTVHLAALVLFLVALFAVAATSEIPSVSFLGGALAVLAAYVFRLGPPRHDRWDQVLVLGAGIWVVCVAHPIVLGRRAARASEPYLLAVLVSVALFPLFRVGLEEGGFHRVIGLLPLAVALGLSALLARLLTLGVPPEENRGRLALVAGAALAFVTVAIPLQFEREWLTLGWALLGAALAWLWGRISHRALVPWSLTLFGAAFVRLALNPAVLTYHARTPTPVWNWYLAVYTVAAAAFFIGFALFRRTDSVPYGGAVRLLPAGGTALFFVLLNLEIADYFAAGRAPSFNVLSSSLSEGLAYTLSWALFAIALLVAGLLAKSRPTRIAALVLLVITILKCFLFDLAQLGGLYRVASFVGLAACLAVVALLLQRFVLARSDPKP